MTLTYLPGYPDRIGKRFAFVGTGNGPAAYVTGGDTVTLPSFQNYIDAILSSSIATVSGTYTVRAIPSVGGKRATWKLKWYTTAAPQTEVSANTNLSAEVLVVAGFGGMY